MLVKVCENSRQRSHLEDLKQILGAPGAQIVNLLEVGGRFHDADITWLTIPRSGAAQVLAFSSYINPLGGMREPGGSSNLHYGVGNDSLTAQAPA